MPTVYTNYANGLYYTMFAIPLIAILLYILLAGRLDKVADNLAKLGERVAKLEVHQHDKPAGVR